MLERQEIRAERSPTRLQSQLPETTLSACWWLTNAPPEDPKVAAARDSSVQPKLLCKSLGVLRAELHQNQVTTIAKTRTDRQCLRSQNEAAQQLLQRNPFCKKFAREE